MFLFVPLVVSLLYGNIPFYRNNYLSNADQGRILYNQQLSTQNQLKDNSNQIQNSFLPTHYSASEARYYVKKDMSFLHVLRDTFILFGVAILSIIVDRKLGLFDGVFRR